MFKILIALVLCVSISACADVLGSLGAAASRAFGFAHTSSAPAYVDVKSINFNGSSQSAHNSNVAAQQFSTAMTMSVWLKSGDTGGEAAVSKADISGSFIAWYIGWSASNKLRVILSHSGGFDTIYASSTTVFNNAWHHVVFTFASSTLNVYIDGALDANSPVSAGYSTIFNSTQPVQIGALSQGGSPTYFFGGNIDELTLWNVALTSGNVTALYNSGHPNDPTTNAQASGLVSWYKLGDSPDAISAGGIIDNVGGYNMTPVGTPVIQSVVP